jgi:hypothetical protein
VLSTGVRTPSRDVGLGVVDALQERPRDEPPGWRAQQMARGAMRGIDEGLEDERFHESLAGAIDGAVDSALSTAAARSPELQKLAEDTARAFARGALSEVRAQLSTPLVLLGCVAGLGLLGALLLRRA